MAQGGPDPALQKGQQWLQAQTKPDGSLASEAASPALPAQSRHETVAALKALNASVPATLIAGMDGFTAPATRYLAQRALTRQQAGVDDASLLDALAALQNPNGSFGAAQGLPGNALDTAWALRALAASRAGRPCQSTRLAHCPAQSATSLEQRSAYRPGPAGRAARTGHGSSHAARPHGTETGPAA